MQALRRELLPPSGVEFTASLNLTPAINGGKEVFRNLVVARSSFLRIFEVREELAPLPSIEDVVSSGRKGMEAVEGEVEMDEQGEGFVNVGVVKPAVQNQNIVQSTVTRLYFIRSHRLHGIITGLDRVQTLATAEDGLDRLVISFKDAKIALMEWSEASFDLTTISIHTYERAPQLLSFNASHHQARLRMDPNSRCAALSLPRDGIAILPFYQSQADLDVGEQDQAFAKDVPYSASFVLDLTQVDERIHNVIDFVFPPGFNNPTLAILCEPQQTWTGRLKEIKDTVSLFIVTLDLNTRTYPIIAQVHSLPYDCMALLPCPTSYGGVIVSTPNSIFHVDQTGRTIVTPSNGWAPRVTDLRITDDADSGTRNVALEGSCMVFVEERKLFVFAADGTVYPVELVVEGRAVTNIVISLPLVQLAIPTSVLDVGKDHLFLGSTVGPSLLLKVVKVLEEVKDASQSADTIGDSLDLDMDLDDDIYGEKVMAPEALANGATNGSVETRVVLHLSLRDSLKEHGPISDMAFALAQNGDRYVPELVTCTGSGHTAGFTLFQACYLAAFGMHCRDLPTRIKRKLHAIGGSRGVWSLSVRPGSKLSTSGRAGLLPDVDSIIVSTDATPTPGLSRMASRSPKSDVVIFGRATVTTIGAASFFQRTAILQVTTNAIRVLETDGTERQVIKDTDGNVVRPKIRVCSISDPFILILREDDTLGLFVGEAERGKIRRKDMSAMGDKTSRYLAASFVTDQTGLFKLANNPGATHGKSKLKGQTTTLEAATDASRGTQWLMLCRPQGVMEIWSLPKLTLAFSTSIISPLQSTLADSYHPVAKSIPENPPRKAQSFDIEQMIIAPIGENDPILHLFVYLRCSQLAVYRIHGVPPPNGFPGNREASLLIQFTKILSVALDSFDETEHALTPENKRIQRRLIPFVTTVNHNFTLSGVFFTGDRPHWIINTDRAGVKLVPCSYSVVHAFTTCSVWDSKSDFLLYTDEGPCLIEWIPEVSLDSAIPSFQVSRGRPYSNIAYDAPTGLIVAASSLKTSFVMFDDDGSPMWTPDAPNVGDPQMECSTIELISPDDWATLDGFEFPSNEFINAVQSVELETLSTATNVKDFIAVATTVYRGEDLAVKGAAYIFEVVEVVPDPTSKRCYRLRLHCRDDAKGAVTAICGINGYLASSMGQKIFVRAFDLDERLVGVAFLDVGVYVTSIRSLKNTLIIGDAVQGVWFVAFQEDPFKLIVLGKYAQNTCITSVDFFFRNDEMSIVAGDEDGVIRILAYDPTNVESDGGQRLILRTEFHGQSEYRSSVTTVSRIHDDMPCSRLLTGRSVDGSLHVLIPVEEPVYKRLQLLQGQLTRNIQHIAGLNPRAFRIVRNEYASRPLTKGILDDGLLEMFDDLAVTKQVEMTRQIASDRSIIVKDLTTNAGSW
ncbi:CPSF A subunit region-domain-containing protein [Hysterangium stoloniferum]|nr:CPSF A subunit region-domain-containing protein [Hysterangium stoloniferum]